MPKLNSIIINSFQLNALLTEEKKKIYKDIIKQDTYCTTCDGICAKGIEITEIQLDPLNDIMLRGVCKNCRMHVV